MLALEFSVDNIDYLIDATFVDSIMTPPRETAFIPRHDSVEVELFSFRGEITPLLNFNALLDLPQKGKDIVMTFFLDNRFFAFHVSSIGSVITIEESQILAHRHPTSITTGLYESPTNKIYSIVDTHKFHNMIQKSAKTE